MKVTVVGYWGGFPAANEATTGYLVEHDGFQLLVDCGSGVLSQLQNYIRVEELDAVILTHYHHDHIADIGPLQYARLISNMLGRCDKTLPIYAHNGDTAQFDKLTHKGLTEGIAYDPEQSMTIGPFEVTFLLTKHPVECYAMRITTEEKTLVFTADSSFKHEFIDFADSADLFICECNLYEGQDGSSAGHMTSVEAGTIAKEANVKQLLLTHLPHFGVHQELVTQAAQIYQGPIQLAKSGYIWE